MSDVSISPRDHYEREMFHLSAQMQDFIRRWKPTDSHEVEHFERETYFLFQRAQNLAQQPLIQQMSAAMATVPFSLLLPKAQP